MKSKKLSTSEINASTRNISLKRLKSFKTKKINYSFLIPFLITINIGALQMGISIGFWNGSFISYQYLTNYNPVDPPFGGRLTLFQSAVIGGSVFGALAGGPFLSFGR